MGRPDQETLFARIGRRRRRQEPRRLSTVLRILADGSEERLSIARLVEVFQDRAFGGLMFVFALPNIIPLPPGASSVLGAPLIMTAIQLLLGRHTLWLPRALLRLSIRKSDLKRLVTIVGRYLRWIERLLSP